MTTTVRCSVCGKSKVCRNGLDAVAWLTAHKMIAHGGQKK